MTKSELLTQLCHIHNEVLTLQGPRAALARVHLNSLIEDIGKDSVVVKSMESKLRYTVNYTHGNAFVVVDTQTNAICDAFMSKSDAISKAQHLNGIEIDGNEQTFARQLHPERMP